MPGEGSGYSGGGVSLLRFWRPTVCRFMAHREEKVESFPGAGGLRAQPWITRSLHLTRGRGWCWGNPQWGFFSLKAILSDFGSIAFCQKPTMIPRALYTPRVVTGCGAHRRPESVLPWVTRAGHTTPSHGLAFFCQDPQNGGKASVASSWGAQRGLQASGGPLETSGGPSSRCRWAALSWGMSCFFAFCCDGAPQLSRGDWEVCWCYMLPPSMGKHYCCIDAAH